MRIYKSVAIALILLLAVGCASANSQSEKNAEPSKSRRQAPDPATIMQELDSDKDGKISLDEAQGRLKDDFSKVDTNEDGFITMEELENMPKPESGRRGPGGPPPGGRR